MNTEELKKAVSEWIVAHPNSYNQGIEEKVYWNMLDILRLLEEITPETKENTTQICNRMFNRFKYYY